MAKSNKELAVELYSAILNAAATISASPRATAGTVQVPTLESAVDEVAKCAKLLSRIPD